MTRSITLLVTMTIVSSVQADWPMFRGPRVSGHAIERGLLARTSNVDLKIRWKKPLGSGYSSVSTSNGRAYTAFSEGGSEYVACFANADGELVWKQRTSPTWKGANGSFDGPIATPAIGFGNVFMLTPSGVLCAFDAESGEPAWSVNVPEEFETTAAFYGFGSSPILTDKHVLVELGTTQGLVCAFDPPSGDLAWTAGEDAVGYQNPVPVRWGGKELMVWAGNTHIGGIDPISGEAAFTFAHEGLGARGAWSLIPVPLPGGKLFLAHDDTTSRVIQVSLGSGTDSTLIESMWDGRTIRNSYNVPVAIDDNLFAYSSRILTCVDGATGKTKWRSRKPGDGFLAVVDDHLVIVTKSGTMHLAKVSDDGFEQISETPVFDDVTWSIPAIDGNAAYVRSIGEIARVDFVVRSTPTTEIVEATKVGPTFQKFLDAVAESSQKSAVVDRFLGSVNNTPFVEGDTVHFLLRGDYEDAAVASDLFGARQEREMIRIDGTNLFYFAAQLPEESRLSYVFVADYKTISDPLNSRTVQSSLLAEDIEMAFFTGGETLQMSWFDMPKRESTLVPDSAHQLRGKLTELKLTSKAMNETEIPVAVYTPPAYRTEGPRYPTVYVHDGGPARDSGHLPELVEQLITSNAIREAVVVFIDYRFHPLFGAEGYDAMLSSDLIPLIESEFHVSSDRADRTAIGGGPGAFLTLTSGMANKSLVSKLALHSPFWFEFLKPWIDGTIAVDGPEMDVLMTWGQFDLFNPEENWNMGQMASLLPEQLRSAGHKVVAQETPDGTDWVCWRTYARDSFTFLLGPPR